MLRNNFWAIYQLCITFWRSAELLPKVAASFFIHKTVYEVISYYSCFLAFAFACNFAWSHPNECAVASYYHIYLYKWPLKYPIIRLLHNCIYSLERCPLKLIIICQFCYLTLCYWIYKISLLWIQVLYIDIYIDILFSKRHVAIICNYYSQLIGMIILLSHSVPYLWSLCRLFLRRCTDVYAS